MSEITISIGNNIDVLKGYPDNHFDSVVTDAPYGLGKEPDAVKLIQDWIDHGYHEISGTGFMGKKWDAFVPQPIFWKEVLRVLKPGGHLLCFFGTRTYDWGTLAIRLAGFEIRDMITWHYGSGFPKSHDVSKGIDKQAGVERIPNGKTKAGHEGFANRGNLSSVKGLKGTLGGVGGFSRPWMDDLEKVEAYHQDSDPVTDDAKTYDGWGTALKPATENVCVARKPLVGTVASNMIEYGTGGINIDACRIELNGDYKSKSNGRPSMTGLDDGYNSELANIQDTIGRFPANVIFDPFTADILDEQTGILASGKPCGKQSIKENGIYGDYAGGVDITGFGDSGGASRFFYVAKPSKDERNAGCEHLQFKDPACVTDFRPTLKSNPEAWAETDTPFTRTDERKNFHPTVKPITLMRYLQRLVTPIGGLTLDPFAGSGTSGCSASFEGFDIVLIEAEEEYLPIIEARTTYWKKEAERLNRIEGYKQSQSKLF